MAGILAGIKPKWTSEIAPYPTLVTHRRLPEVKHYGDVSKISGKGIEPVDIITFGSPCQDLSIAGRQAGLIEGKRSSLFFEAIRIIKEMREATNGKKPRYAVWENVCGAFSSNDGKDFNAVLNAFVGCIEDGVQVPAPETGVWPKADLLLGDGWSVAYRTFDAQFWGVPQRRTRIYLVADFNGESAGKILFEPEGVSRNTAEGFCPWQGAAGSAENRTGTAIPIENHAADSRVKLSEDGKVQTLTERMGTGGGNVPLVAEPAYGISKIGFQGGEKAAFHFAVNEEISPTLEAAGPHAVAKPAYGISKEAYDSSKNANFDFSVMKEKSPTIIARSPCAVAKPEIKAYGVCSKHSNGMLSDNPKVGFYEATTSRTLDQSGGNPTSNQGGMCVVEPVAMHETYDIRFTSEGTKNVRGHVYQTNIARCLDSGGADPDSNHGGIAVMAFEPGIASRNGDHIYTDGKSRALRADPGDNRMSVVVPAYSATVGSFMNFEKEKTNSLMARDYKDPPIVNEPGYIVRRLTPTECARLQGFPDWWCMDLAIPNPSEEELLFWQDVWDTWDDINGHKHKTFAQIRKWLADPYSDAEEYRLWGNGVALPCPFHVLKGIALEGR